MFFDRHAYAEHFHFRTGFKIHKKLWITIALRLSWGLFIALILNCERNTHRLPKRTQRNTT